MFQNADEAKKFIADEDVKFVDVRFCDLPGVMQHFTVPGRGVRRRIEDGSAFDGSSIRGFQAIHESDMVLRADLSTAAHRPVPHATRRSTSTSSSTTRSPASRTAATRATSRKKAEAYLASTGIADTAYFGPEAEFYVFDDVRFETKRERGLLPHRLRVEGAWNTGAARRAATAATRSATRAATSRSRRSTTSPTCAPRSSLELDDVRPQGRAPAPRGRHRRPGRDQLQVQHAARTRPTTCMLFKYIVKNVAWRNGKTATFMPKPIFGDNGSGMHAHQSLWKDGEPLFYDEAGYAGLSDIARYYIGGLLKHAPSLLAFTNPTVNSYHRLVPGLRGPGQPGLLAAQPLGLHPHPDHRHQPEGQARRVPRARTRPATRTWPSPRC